MSSTGHMTVRFPSPAPRFLTIGCWRFEVAMHQFTENSCGAETPQNAIPPMAEVLLDQ
jgi:hypothetical protein